MWAGYEDGQPALNLDGELCEPWQVREWGGFSLRNLMETHFDEVFALTESWAVDPSPNVRRGVLLGCKLTKKAATPDRVKRVLKRIALLMPDGHEYIKKNCGAFVVNELGSLQPDIVLAWLKEQAAIADPNVRSNVAKSFTQAFGKRYPQQAMEVLELIVDDPAKIVQSALVSALKNLVKKGGIDSTVIVERFPKQASQVLR